MLAMVTPKCAEAGVKDVAYMHVAGPMVHRCVCAWMAGGDQEFNFNFAV